MDSASKDNEQSVCNVTVMINLSDKNYDREMKEVFDRIHFQHTEFYKELMKREQNK